MFFEEVIAVHRATAQALLQDGCAFATHFLSTKKASRLTELKRDKFERYIDMNGENYEVLINDFLRAFLVPNINREILQQRIANVERKNQERLNSATRPSNID